MLTRSDKIVGIIADIADIAVTAGCYLVDVFCGLSDFRSDLVLGNRLLPLLLCHGLGDRYAVSPAARRQRRGFQAELSSKVQLLCCISLEARWNMWNPKLHEASTNLNNLSYESL